MYLDVSTFEHYTWFYKLCHSNARHQGNSYMMLSGSLLHCEFIALRMSRIAVNCTFLADIVAHMHTPNAVPTTVCRYRKDYTSRCSSNSPQHILSHRTAQTSPTSIHCARAAHALTIQSPTQYYILIESCPTLCIVAHNQPCRVRNIISTIDTRYITHYV
jgi:hypothetical protein